MRRITEAIVHCTATPPDWRSRSSTSNKVREVRRWHVDQRGWSDIGYHYLIDRDGTVAKGRPMHRNGAHVRGHNTGTIGISLFGGKGASAYDNFEDHFTPEQDAALRNLLADLQAEYGFRKITGHNEYAAKGCPGFQVKRWLKRKPSARASIAQTKTVRAAGIGIAADFYGMTSVRKWAAGDR